MADNVTANAGSGGATFATDDVSGVHYPIGKLAFGALDTATIVSSANPLPAVVTQATAAALKVEAVGAAAHDAAVSGNPTRVAGRAASATLAAVTNGDTCDIVTDLNGKIVTMPYSAPEVTVSGATAAITGTSVTEVVAAGAASVRNYVTSILVTNSHATVGTLVEIRDGTTTVLWRGYAAPAGGGFSCHFPKPLRGTAATAINAYNITTGSSTYVCAAGFQAP
jgi:hypothetical protein